MAQDTETLRREIQAMHLKLKDANFYDLLGVTPGGDEAALKQQLTTQFRNLAKKWHVDRYSNVDLGEDREKLQQIFQTINNAHQVLADSKRREEYDLELNGQNTDISAIINAETAFRKGQSMLDQGSYKGAHMQFSAASEMNPDDIEYRAHRLYTEYLLITKDEDGKPLDKTRTQEIYQQIDAISQKFNEKDWILVFLGVVTKGLGREREAERLFRNALQINSRNHSAQRQLRIIEMRKGKKKNFLTELMDKFKKK
ncbi:MAG: DnaJ domain-containing protein [Bradymonadaceae bacterium]|nr:DnaJ domain-containing protein [Lujinxingiaceae bacterium]